MSVRVDDSAEAPEVDNQNAATPSEPTPEGGELTSSAEKTKNWYERHKPKIRVALGVTLAVGLAVVIVVARQAMEQNVTEDTENFELLPDTGAGGSDPSPDFEAADPRKGPVLHLMSLPPGSQPSEARKEVYRQATGDELPPGMTCRGGSSEDEDEGPGEAAA
jgi:hypothetical protein